MILALTGHRPQTFSCRDFTLQSPQWLAIKTKLEGILDEYKPSKVISGMALGCDMMWAELALERRIPLIAAIPFEGMEDKWNLDDVKRYKYIRYHPLTTEKIICEGDYAAYKMQVRNEWMVNNCDKLVAVWDGSRSGGTANCVRYAKNRLKPKQIIYISPFQVLKDYEENNVKAEIQENGNPQSQN